MRVLGIDPGSETLGWGVVDGKGSKYVLVDFGTVKSSTKQAFSKRLLNMYEGVAEVMATHSPDVLSVEDTFYAVNVGVALKLGQVRGLMLLLAERRKPGDRGICPKASQANSCRLRQCREASGGRDGSNSSGNEESTNSA
ncbi:MAG: crossover junction endodeoxyribonuclease RuvC [Acidobacteria bacterium]|nr:crossover junction endodeoxyribonuclease RuvC [Acidobacteriota bacterium]